MIIFNLVHWEDGAEDQQYNLQKVMMTTMRRSSYCVQSQGSPGKVLPGRKLYQSIRIKDWNYIKEGQLFFHNSICDVTKGKYISKHFVQIQCQWITMRHSTFGHALGWAFDISHLQMSGDENRFAPALRWQSEPFEDKNHFCLSKMFSTFINLFHFFKLKNQL